tara:strand:+ start:3540 stop:4208 length:669 start_codon:yes stop_codon:yes gene_type:complete
MASPKFIPFYPPPEYSESQRRKISSEYYELMNNRRTVREFSSTPISLEVIDDCIKTANTAPSGANLQPWHFCVVSDANVKSQIRIAAEKEEHEFYTHRATPEWLEALEPLGTNEQKDFLETAPVLIVVFMQKYGKLIDGRPCKHYYPQESVGLATGMLISAIHNAGLVSLTHTPSPMNFLNKILDRPENERPFLLLVVGHASSNAEVPNIHRKTIDQIRTII